MSETEFKPGDVVRYTPDPARYDPRWCREGMAICNPDGALLDTYWATLFDAHRLTAAEVVTAEVLFNIGDCDELDQYSTGSKLTWDTYAEADRHVITSQHRLQFRWFVRKGANPDLPTQIDNARRALTAAEWDVDAARRRRDRREADLDRLLDATTIPAIPTAPTPLPPTAAATVAGTEEVEHVE